MPQYSLTIVPVYDTLTNRGRVEQSGPYDSVSDAIDDANASFELKLSADEIATLERDCVLYTAPLRRAETGCETIRIDEI